MQKKEDLLDIITLKKEIISRYSKSNSESKKFEYNKKSICVGEFAIDIVLFQIFHNSYKVESFRALCKALGGKIADGVLELPDKYRYFISDRLKEKKLNNDQEKIKELEKIKQRKKEEDEILFESTYKQMFDKVEQHQKKIARFTGGPCQYKIFVHAKTYYYLIKNFNI